MVVPEHIWLPLVAIVALGFLDQSWRHGFAVWFVNLGWDSCVLALGAAPAVFLSHGAAQLFHSETNAVLWGFAYVVVCMSVGGGLLAHLRELPYKHDGHAIVSLSCGGALLGSLVWVGDYVAPALTN